MSCCLAELDRALWCKASRQFHGCDPLIFCAAHMAKEIFRTVALLRPAHPDRRFGLQAYIERNFQPPILFRDVRELGGVKATTAYGAQVGRPPTTP